MHADELHLRHAAANGRVEAAQGGVPVGSAAALSAAVAKWHTDTTTVFGNLVQHSDGLRGAAAGYLKTDEGSAAAIKTAVDQASDVDLGL